MSKKQTKKQLQEELELLELQKRILELKRDIRLLEDESLRSIMTDYALSSNTASWDIFVDDKSTRKIVNHSLGDEVYLLYT